MFEIEIPANLENLQLPDPGLLAYYQNKEKRSFWIDFDIDTGLLEITKEIIEINRLDADIPIEERKPIKIMIFSSGGDLYAAINLLNVMLISATPIHTYNMGMAMSAGLLILLAGSKRYCLGGSKAMIHSGSAGIMGTAEQVEDTSKDYKKTIEYMQDYILSRANIDKKEFGRKKARDWYLDVPEQLKYGICHETLDSLAPLL